MSDQPSRRDHLPWTCSKHNCKLCPAACMYWTGDFGMHPANDKVRQNLSQWGYYYVTRKPNLSKGLTSRVVFSNKNNPWSTCNQR